MAVRELNSVLAKIAKEQLGEGVNGSIEDDIASIREWMSKQPHLQHIKLSDQWILSFIRGCKFSLEKAKSKLDTFYLLKSTFPEVSNLLDPLSPKMQKLLSLGVILMLPKTGTADSPRVKLLRIEKISGIPVDDLIGLNHMITTYTIMNDDHTVICGQYNMVDFAQKFTDLLPHLTVNSAKKLSVYSVEALPLRNKGGQFLNCTPGVESALALLNQIIPKKSQERLRYHRTLDELHQVIPKSELPVEYGGENYTIQELIDETKKKMEDARDFFLQELENYSDESRRPGKPKTMESFGLEGSFRKLNID